MTPLALVPYEYEEVQMETEDPLSLDSGSMGVEEQGFRSYEMVGKTDTARSRLPVRIAVVCTERAMLEYATCLFSRLFSFSSSAFPSQSTHLKFIFHSAHTTPDKGLA